MCALCAYVAGIKSLHTADFDFVCVFRSSSTHRPTDDDAEKRENINSNSFLLIIH